MSMQRTTPRAVTLREEFVSRLRSFVDKHFGGDWKTCFSGCQVQGLVTRGTVILLVEREDPEFVAKFWGVVAHQVDMMDADRDGYISEKEFLALNESK